jgi:hypothetical protein
MKKLLLAALVTAFVVPTAGSSFAKNENAPGQKQMYPGQAKKFAPGHLQKEPGDAKNYAPGRQDRQRN